jgi:hypothetical protein
MTGRGLDLGCLTGVFADQRPAEGALDREQAMGRSGGFRPHQHISFLVSVEVHHHSRAQLGNFR